jgi:uncharacterized protein (DUF1697 family)
MTVRVGFLRAVNVGRRRVAMSRLKAVGEALGHTDVWTHINSGNVVFDATGSRASVEQAFESALEEELGFECTTFVRTATELDTILSVRPFSLAPGDTYFVTFLKQPPSPARTKDLEALSGDFDTLVVEGAEVHWRMHGRSSDSPLTRRDWERVLGPLSSTSRNVTMLRTLSAKIDARSAAQPPHG